MTHTTLITGANRGIGLALVEQYLKQGEQVIACCRQPEQAVALQTLAQHSPLLSVYPLDVTDSNAITALAQSLRQRPLDRLILNAGLYGPKGAGLGDIEPQIWQQVLAVNTIAPLMLVQALLPNLQLGELKIIAALSSKMGSMADNSSGGSYIYRSSKAALNAVIRSLAIDLGSAGFNVFALHPGWVQTEMGGPNALIDTRRSAAGLRAQLETLPSSLSGHLIDYQGVVIPW